VITYEERQKLLEVATSLRDELHRTNDTINKVVNSMLSEADGLLPKAADEIEAGDVKVAKPVKYATETGRVDTSKPNITPPPLASGKRACSLCREPGHRASNCPNAHTVRVKTPEKMTPATLPPVKPKRTMSPERKAQLAETLKKARAARSKK